MKAPKPIPEIKGIFSVYGRDYLVEYKKCSVEFSGLSKTTKVIEFWGCRIEPWPKVPE